MSPQAIASDHESNVVLIGYADTGLGAAWHRPDTGWETPEAFSTRGASLVRLAFDAAGNAICSWTQSGLHVARFARDAGWVTLDIVLNGVGADHSLAVNAAGNAIVLWRKESGPGSPHIWAVTYAPESGWGIPEQLENHTEINVHNPAVALAPDGTGLAAWSLRSNTRWELMLADYSPTTGWGAPYKADPTGVGNVLDVSSLAFDGDGNAFVTWGATAGVWVSRRMRGADWGAPELLGDGRIPRIQVRPDGVAVAAWVVADNGWRIMSSEFHSGTGWTSPVNIGLSSPPSDQSYFFLDEFVLNPNGDGFLITTEEAWDNDMKVIGYSAANGWQQTVELGNEPTLTDAAQLAVDPLGRALIVWRPNLLASDAVYSRYGYD